MTESSTLIFIVALIALFGYAAGYRRSMKQRRQQSKQQHTRSSSLPRHYGSMIALWCAIPSLFLLLGWSIAEPAWLDHQLIQQLSTQQQSLSDEQQSLLLNPIKIALADNANDADSRRLNPAQQALARHYTALKQRSKNLKTTLLAVILLGGLILGLIAVRPHLHARPMVESMIRWLLLGCSLVAILTTIGILFSVAFESLLFFDKVSIVEFMFGTHWSPQTSIRSDQVGSSGSFGAVPLFVGTMLISAIALLIAVPLGLMSAIYLSEYASHPVRDIAKPGLEILAGIPTVVYGFFAALTVAPMLRGFGEILGLSVSSESALAAGLVMGIMIVPFVSSLSDDVIRAVPQTLRDGSYSLGATRSETILQVVIPAALPGIVGGVLLAASRAIGETMIVVMAAGLAANLTANPLDSVTTVTVQIVTLLTGDQEFDSAKTLAAFALGLMLFFTTLILNIIALKVVRRYREHYE